MSGSSSDDEFDDLFSFSTATPTGTGKSGSTAVALRAESSSPINFDLPEEGVDGNAIKHTSVDKDSSAGDVATSAHTSDTGSYYKVSPPTSATTVNDNDDDDDADTEDVDAIFDLDAVKPSMELKDDDFHAMDADTREFLDFLDKEPEKKTGIHQLVAQGTDGFSDEEGDDGDDDDGMMDFVDIDADANTNANVQSATSNSGITPVEEMPLTPTSSSPPKATSPLREPTLLEDMEHAEMKQKNENEQVKGTKEKSDKGEGEGQEKSTMTHGNAPTIAAVPPKSPSRTQPQPPKSSMGFMSRVHTFSKPMGPVRVKSVPGKLKDGLSRSPMKRSVSASGRGMVPISPISPSASTGTGTGGGASTAANHQNSSILMSFDSIDAEQADLAAGNSTNATTDSQSDLTAARSEKSKSNTEGNDETEEGQGQASTSNSGETISIIPIPEEKEIVFSSLSEAIHSPDSTMKHIRPLFYLQKTQSSNPMEIAPITNEERPWLWSKAICWNKTSTLDDVESSSLADSFTTWDEMFDMDALIQGARTYELQETFRNKLLHEADLLAANLIASDAGTGDVVLAKRDICSLLIFYYRSTYISRSTNDLNADSFEDGNDNVKGGADGDVDDGKAGGDFNDDLQFEEEVKENLKMVQSKDEEGSASGEQEEPDKENDDNVKDVGGSEDGGTAESEPSEPKAEDNGAPEVKSNAKDPENTNSSGTLKGIKPKDHFVEWNALVGPVAVTLLSSGMSTPVVSVMISRIVPAHMPLIPLTKMERVHAVKTLHQKLYFLICYHLPLLVLHLDKNIPGWHWPKSLADDEDENEIEEQHDVDADSATKRSRNLEAQGTIPITWFTSLLAGENSSSPLPPKRLLALWDILLTTDNLSIKFFLALSVLERNSDNLLMLKGQELIDELTAVMSLDRNDELATESFVGTDVATENASLTQSQKHILSWCNHAQSLRESTPLTIIEQLSAAEDKALNFALNLRSKLAMEKMKARLEAEAEAHRQAVEEENARKLEERMHKYYKEKLEKFYKRHCPEKIDSIDKILEVYKDRYQVLDNKLIFKYGRGFLPLISVFNPQMTSKTNKIISNVGQGIENKKKKIILSRAEDRAKMLEDEMRLDGTHTKHQVAAKVDAKEVLPVVCAGHKSQTPIVTRESLKYYLVDSRPEETLKFQGAFPTAARLSPEDLMDPDRIQEKVEMFESLRGGAHIVIMGEGFSALPNLYGHQLSKVEEKLLDNDESRTNMCALFFIKKGFPFVSVLDGGFAAAHAWLARDCDYFTLNEVLIDYDEETSLFADLHKSYQEQKEFASASARRKTTIAMQRLIDNSMTRLTQAESQLEGFTDRVIAARKEAKEKSMREKETKSKMEQEEKEKDNTESSSANASNDSKSFKNAFVGIRNKVAHKEKIDNDVEEGPKAFDFSKISFGRRNNAMTKNKKSEDDELEKEIAASLTPIKDDTASSKPKPPASPVRKIRFGGRNNSTDDGNKKDGGPLAFKNALGMSFRKFNTMKPRKPKSETTSALREEESIFFDEDA